jgi:hypothetical protein
VHFSTALADVAYCYFLHINDRLIGGMATAPHAQQAQLSQMRALLQQGTQASGGTQTLAPDQQRQTLLQQVEPEYLAISRIDLQNYRNKVTSYTSSLRPHTLVAEGLIH